MKHIAIVVPEGDNNLSSIVGSYKILTRANTYWEARTKRPGFVIEFVGTSKEVTFHHGCFSVRPHTHIDAVSQTNLIIIPSLSHQFDHAVRVNQPLIDWIRRQYKNGAEVASICTGAFLLAAAGLLNGRSCSTHWAFADDFRARFPQARLQPDRLITDELGIYTNGGAYSFLNLMLYLVEKYFDRQTAIDCSKVFQIDPDRTAQSPFMIFTGQKKHGDSLVQRAQEYIEKHFPEKISVEQLSAACAIGRRNFDRRFVRATGNTPIEYTQKVRIEAAKRAFETTRKNVNEVMFEVGYSDTKAFREVFRRVTGMSPVAYRNRYNRYRSPQSAG